MESDVCTTVTNENENDKDNTNDNNELENVNNNNYSNGVNVTESHQRTPEHFFDELLLPNDETTFSGNINEQEQEVKYSKYLQTS